MYSAQFAALLQSAEDALAHVQGGYGRFVRLHFPVRHDRWQPQMCARCANG